MIHDDDEQAVRERLASVSGTAAGDWFLVFKARYGMQVVWEQLRRHGGPGEVLTQAYTCATAVTPIISAGMLPRYVDIDKSSMMVDPTLVEFREDSRAVVLQHTFGLVTPVACADIAGRAHSAGALVMEDSAHCLGVIVRDGEGVPVADVSVHSFGVEKILPTCFGGAVWVNPRMEDTELRSAIVEALSTLPVIDHRTSVVSRAYAIQNRVLNHLPARLSGALRRVLERGRLIEAPIAPAELAGTMPHPPARPAPWMLRQVLSSLQDLDGVRNTRRTATSTYARLLADAGVEVPTAALDTSPLVRFPFFAASPSSAERLGQNLRHSGHFAGCWYRPLLFPGPSDPAAFRFDPDGADVPVSRDLAARAVNLLTNVPPTEAESTARLVAESALPGPTPLSDTLGNEDFVPVFLGTSLGAYSLARSLHEAFGIRSLALGRAPLDETRDSDIIEVRVYEHMDRPAFVVQTLQELALEFPGRKLFLIPTIELYTDIVQDNRPLLDPLYEIPLPGREAFDRLVTKTTFHETCAELDIPCPRTIVVDRTLALSDPTLGTVNLPMPVIVKASDTDGYQSARFAGKQKVYRADTRRQMSDIISLVYSSDYVGDMVLQEFIPGDEEVMLICNTYSDREGRVRAVVTGQIVLSEYNPALVGNYNAILGVDVPEVSTMVTRLLEGVGYVGYANLDVMLDRSTGTWKLLEVNIRPGGSNFYTMAAGVNLARLGVDEYVYGTTTGVVTPVTGRLWVNAPMWTVRMYAPQHLRQRAFAHPLGEHSRTFDYAPDSSGRRRRRTDRVLLRHGIDTVRYARARINR